METLSTPENCLYCPENRLVGILLARITPTHDRSNGLGDQVRLYVHPNSEDRYTDRCSSAQKLLYNCKQDVMKM